VAATRARPGGDGGATAKALDYSLNQLTALTRNLLDGEVPVDNNISKTRSSLGDGPPGVAVRGQRAGGQLQRS